MRYILFVFMLCTVIFVSGCTAQKQSSEPVPSIDISADDAKE
jgi:hypothetical protein